MWEKEVEMFYLYDSLSKVFLNFYIFHFVRDMFNNKKVQGIFEFYTYQKE